MLGTRLRPRSWSLIALLAACSGTGTTTRDHEDGAGKAPPDPANPETPAIDLATMEKDADHSALVPSPVETQKALEASGIECLALDVLDDAAVAAAVAGAGPLDVLFNCAGFVHQNTIESCTDAEWDFGFALKARHALGVGAESRRQNFDRDLAFEIAVDGAVDDAGENGDGSGRRRRGRRGGRRRRPDG